MFNSAVIFVNKILCSGISEKQHKFSFLVLKKKKYSIYYLKLHAADKHETLICPDWVTYIDSTRIYILPRGYVTDACHRASTDSKQSMKFNKLL